MDIISLDNALKSGLSKYFTGDPCKRGHLSPRYVKGKLCTECCVEHAVSRRKAKPETYTEYNKKLWAKTKDTQTAEDKKRKNINRARYQKKNPGKVTAASRKHQLAKLKRTPRWADMDEIEKIYELSAKNISGN